MSKIKDADFMAQFPPALKKDGPMLALGQLIAEELHITANETRKNIIYANMGELSETWLDVLAYDLHVDWYDYDYPVEAKRAIIKDSIRVHQKLGTTGATERALGGLHPQSEIEEWYDYDGRPFYFRIVLDTTNSRVAVDYDEIVNTVDIYKRLTSHLDGLYYQCSMCIIIMPQTEYFLFQTPMTGRLRAGTYPHRNTEGVVLNAVIDIDAQAAGHIAKAVPTGTRPYRNITFTAKDSGIVTDSDTMGYKYIAGQTGRQKTGTEPYRQTEGGAGPAAVAVKPRADATKYDSVFAGTKPDRNITAVFEETAAVGEADTEAYIFENAVAGTKPRRNIVHGRGDIRTVADTEAEGYRYRTGTTGKEKAGRKPYINKEPGISNRGMATTADTESYQYEVKRCGKNRL